MMDLPRLYAVADASFGDPVELARQLFRGGARLVEIRSKRASARELLDQTSAVLEFAPQDAMVIVNDRVDVALVSGAMGVHLGQEDLPPGAARQILGSGKIIGYSTHNEAQARIADALPVDYIAVGPVFPTTTKHKPDPVIGVDRMSRICGAVRKPVVAIGGITLDRARDVLSSGARSVAVISDLYQHENIVDRTREFIRALASVEGAG